MGVTGAGGTAGIWEEAGVPLHPTEYTGQPPSPCEQLSNPDGKTGKAAQPRFNPGLSSTRVKNYLAPFYLLRVHKS